MSHPKDVSHPRFSHLPLSTSGPIECALKGTSLLRSPYRNKGSAFSKAERDDFGVKGLVPVNVQTLEEQVMRAYEQYRSRTDDLGKNTSMAKMFPIIYTPTEGETIANYSKFFRRPEGCFLDINDPNGVNNALDMWGSEDDIDLIVVSDAEQILGIGDQGVGGVLISVAKLVIYTACAGIHPHLTLPIVLDCGTDNQDLLKDELYLGNKHGRVRGDRYNAFVEQFVQAARSKYPKAYLHCEDLGISNARRILDEYRDKVPISNDDVQGTRCVSLAALMAASIVSNQKLKDLRVICYGAGTAGTGIADKWPVITQAIAVESEKSKKDAAKQIWCIDKQGLLLSSESDSLTAGQKQYAKSSRSDWKDLDPKSLQSVITHVQPHVLIGTSTHVGAFTEDAVREMTKHVERPIIFPLSNPTCLHEAVPQDLMKWTDGKALVATGSPFPPVTLANGDTYQISECNNSTVFPGIGLGAILSRANRCTNKMLVAATQAVAAKFPCNAEGAGGDAKKGILPDVADVREVSVQIAVAVVKAALEEGIAEEKDIPDEGDGTLEE